MSQIVLDFINNGVADFSISGQCFRLCHGKAEDAKALFDLQEDLPFEIYIPSTLDELIVATENNTLYIIKQENILAAFMIFLPNGSNSGYSEFTEEKNFAAIDAVYVEKRFRGNNFQMLFLKLAEELAKLDKIDCLAATVSKHNKHSFRNFINCGYEVLENVNYNMFGEMHPRLFVMKRI